MVFWVIALVSLKNKVVLGAKTMVLEANLVMFVWAKAVAFWANMVLFGGKYSGISGKYSVNLGKYGVIWGKDSGIFGKYIFFLILHWCLVKIQWYSKKYSGILVK